MPAGPPAGPGPELRTDRLVLRRWRPGDLAPLAAINGDPAVTDWLAASLTRAESDALVERFEREFDTEGIGTWAVVDGGGELVGAVGLGRVTVACPLTGRIEVGWRLARAAWGRGYATEAAAAAVAFAFERGEPEVVAMTAEANRRSRAVMERLGMRRDAAEDFVHPALPADHRLQPHVCYRLAAP